MGKAPFHGDVLGGSTTHELVVQEEPCGLVDESFGAAFTLRTVWTARGQHPCCPPPAHTLRPLAHRVHRANNRVKVSRTEKYIPVSSIFYYNLQLTKMVHAECLPTNSAEEPAFFPTVVMEQPDAWPALFISLKNRHLFRNKIHSVIGVRVSLQQAPASICHLDNSYRAI